MSADTTLMRLRSFLLGLSVFLLAGTLVELWFTDHMEEPVQLIPFFLSGAGILISGAALLRPSPGVLRALHAVMAVVAAGSLFGTYEHVANNIAFQMEIQPGLTALEKLVAGLGGANPLLAPGILGIAALLSIAATYRHPALAPSRQSVREEASMPALRQAEMKQEK